jgi:hypothetical protein
MIEVIARTSWFGLLHYSAKRMEHASSERVSRSKALNEVSVTVTKEGRRDSFLIEHGHADEVL